MDISSLMVFVTPALALGVVAILISAIQHRRHRERLVAMGTRHGMGLVQGKLSAAATEHARRFGRSKHKVKLRDVLVGDDEEGRFHFSQRSIARRRHHVVFAMNSSDVHVEQFHVIPQPAVGKAKRRWFARADRIQAGSDWRLELQWNSARSGWLGGHSLGIAARVLGLLARMSDAKGAVPMGLELHGRSVIIHTTRPLRGAEMDRFMDDAIRLRKQILHTVRSVEGRIGERNGRSSGSRVVDLDSVKVQVLSTR